MNAEELRYWLRRPIAFHRVFAELAGSAAGGLFLSQLFYWSDKGTDPEGWIYKTIAEWTEETALSRREQESARAALVALGVLEVERRGLPARLHFRLDVDRLASLLDVTNKIARPEQTTLADQPNIPTENTTDTEISTRVRSIGEMSAMLRRPGLGRR